ncbi:MAG: hypothetical protein O2919_04545 [Chloroflexi bacterium]|nr:hypothetical protein [Chloroflexota bacterium]
MPNQDEVLSRLNRVYAALDESIEADLTQFPAQVISDGGLFGILQEFHGGLTPAQIENLAYAVIHNITNLIDHLKRWARGNSNDLGPILRAEHGSLALQILRDLSNNDKHGYSPRHTSRSGKSPQLREVGRPLRMTTGSAAGSSVAFVFTPEGPKLISHGGGSAAVVITGSIVDRDGQPLGDLYEVELQALTVIEALVHELGLRLE